MLGHGPIAGIPIASGGIAAGPTIVEATGSSVAGATTDGIAAAIWVGVGASAGVATVTGLAAGIGVSVGASAGVATVTGLAAATAAAVGNSAGVATVTGVGEDGATPAPAPAPATNPPPPYRRWYQVGKYRIRATEAEYHSAILAAQADEPLPIIVAKKKAKAVKQALKVMQVSLPTRAPEPVIIVIDYEAEDEEMLLLAM